jgi:predicted LPLAT superfamily acyltransferase
MADSSPHWSRIAESGTVLGMRILLLIYRVFGRWGFRIGLFPVISYYFLSRKQARQASKQYLQRLSDTYPDLGQLSSFRHFLMFGDILLDKLLAWSGHINLDDISFVSDGLFEQALEQQQGGIIVVSHLGNTEVSNALAHQQPGLRLTLLVYTQHAEKFNALMKKMGASDQIEMYQVTEMSPAFAMLMSERVEAGEYLVIAGDRTPVTGQQRVSEVDFLGEKAALPQGAFILASLLKCPVFLMFCLKHEQRYQIHIEQFATRIEASRKQRTAIIQQAQQRYADRLAAHAYLAPLQWFNFYPFWTSSKASTENNEESQ